MALHIPSHHQKDDDLCYNTITINPLNKYKIPEHENNPQIIYQLISDELLLDGNSKQNLATFCQTYSDTEIHKLMDKCIDKNMIDKDEYPQTAEIEERCVNIISDLWHGKKGQSIGTSTTGSSEACMLAGMAMKWRWKIKRQENNKNCNKPNLVCGPVQVCWHKFAKYWDIELREIQMEKDSYISTSKKIIELCDENTIGVVLTLGTTFTGQYEPIKDICNALDIFEKNTSLNIDIHVDAASGGFLAPFCNPDLIWDFRLERVKSISTSGHKFGLTPLGCGWVIWKDKKYLPDDLIFNVNYLGGNMPTFAINFSRPGGQIICQYYNLIRLGKEGYKRIQSNCYKIGKKLADQIKTLNLFDIIYESDPKIGIPAVTWKLKENISVPFTLYDLSDLLRERGWQIPTYSLPKNCENETIQRVLIKYGASYDFIELLFNDLKNGINKLTQFPPSNKQIKKGGFNHGK